ncbi:hypothetical protein CKALI_03695 [Corynebacterium kalinowskii]|uniref:Helix-turn-helix domain-containing protein n=1 Tax=Corynebacterium kalinowskii TaxID=2675216 RepID=A0A6B8VWC9_9CORY|nr:helix-turn-helix domain-containing protein [Corynebacterium kalinowskii]QGU01620.1 hypothetical protein CKALI_03695 [Corynebacterium kalinowskii]
MSTGFSHADNEPYVTLQHASKHFAVSDKLLRRMIAQKQIPAYRIGGRCRGPIRLKISEIESAMYPMGAAM